jgi:DNA polymerase-1
MRYLVFSEPERSSYPICLLVPSINRQEIDKAYIKPHGLDPDDLLVIDLHYNPEKPKKTPKAEMVAYVEQELKPVLLDMAVEYLMVADAEYFKALTKAAKVEAHLGYVMDCVFGPWKVIYVPFHRAIFYDPDKVKAKIAASVTAVIQHRAGDYQAPGATIIRYAAYPTTPEEIEEWLERLIVEDRPLACDIETFSLKHPTAGIGTITFCWNKHEGIAFPVDLGPDPTRVRALLKSFFLRFRQKLLYHKISFDVYILIYQLFMEHILDTEGLLEGLKVMLRNWDCTRLIAYLATNSCAGNQLGLKQLAQEFAGNWAVETIEDITSIPLPDLLQYNLVDGLSTWYVYETYYDQMVADDQLEFYDSIFRPATVDVIQMQLTGMPVNMAKVPGVKAELQGHLDDAIARLQASPLVQQYTYRLREAHVAKRNEKLVKKRITLDDPEVAKVVFNPSSAPQLQEFVYQFMGLPVIALSDSRLPSTKGKVFTALKNHTADPAVHQVLDALVDYKAVIKILQDFIPSLEGAFEGPDGWHYLFGNFNLGGTQSGRLSSSDPNLQNLPATGSRYAKIIKQCFEAPPGWLLVGLDFASLEDKISALTTKDPNKLKVYTDGYDGHSLRAFAYFGILMPDIRQANNRRVFKVTQDEVEHFLIEGDEVQLSDGSVRKIEEIV